MCELNGDIKFKPNVIPCSVVYIHAHPQNDQNHSKRHAGFTLCCVHLQRYRVYYIVQAY